MRTEGSITVNITIGMSLRGVGGVKMEQKDRPNAAGDNRKPHSKLTFSGADAAFSLDIHIQKLEEMILGDYPIVDVVAVEGKLT